MRSGHTLASAVGSHLAAPGSSQVTARCVALSRLQWQSRSRAGDRTGREAVSKKRPIPVNSTGQDAMGKELGNVDSCACSYRQNWLGTHPP
jgi:hypothetical protein